MPLQIIRNDITKVKADAIVNTANPNPVIGSGTDSAIYAAAGEDKLLAARRLIGDIKPGTAIETSAYNLDAKFIIHTVCIPWNRGVEALDVLGDCYHNSLVLAEELNCKSVAFPLIGTGAYGIPHDDAIGVANVVIKAFLKERDSKMKVMLVLFDKDSLDAGQSVAKSIKQYIDEVYVESAVADEYDGPRLNRRNEAYHRSTLQGVSAIEDTKSFAQKMKEYYTLKGIKKSALYGGTYEPYFPRQSMNLIENDPEYHPKKYICVIICLVLKLDLEQTQDMLMRAGYSLSVSRKADVVVRYCIENKIYDVFTVSKMLEEQGCGDIKKLK